MMGLVTLGFSIPRFHFFGRRQAMPAGDGGRPMTDVHGERALLNRCDVTGLTLSTRARACCTPCARAARGTFRKLDCLGLFRFSLFKTKGRTCKRGTEQLARTRDPPRANVLKRMTTRQAVHARNCTQCKRSGVKRARAFVAVGSRQEYLKLLRRRSQTAAPLCTDSPLDSHRGDVGRVTK